MAKKKNTQTSFIPEVVYRYDFSASSKDYLCREDKETPDILLYPPWRQSLLLQLGNMDLLTGSALEEYNTIINGG